MNFHDQSSVWLTNSRIRLRRPVKPATLRTYNALLNTWVNPLIGQECIADFGVAKMKNFISSLASANLSPKTITLTVGIGDRLSWQVAGKLAKGANRLLTLTFY